MASKTAVAKIQDRLQTAQRTGMAPGEFDDISEWVSTQVGLALQTPSHPLRLLLDELKAEIKDNNLLHCHNRKLGSREAGGQVDDGISQGR
ncbi:MAG: hypothetical protein ACYC26_04360 [Phycisphaerales bacterium]